VNLPVLKMLDFVPSSFLNSALVYPFVVGSGREYAPASFPVMISDVVVFAISCRTPSLPSYASSRRRFTFQSEPF
jgi:branched-subunit amino acid transport protein